jgi:hypothetical protein
MDYGILYFVSLAILSSYIISKLVEFQSQIACSIYFRKVVKNRLDQFRIRRLIFASTLKKYFLVTGGMCFLSAIYVSQRNVIDKDTVKLV